MDTPTLTPRQRGVLYALIEQMARHHEIDLSHAIAADRGAADEVLDRMQYIGQDIKSVVNRCCLKLGWLQPIASAAHKLIAGNDLRIPFYLARKFDVPCSTLHFPGITDAPEADTDDAGACAAEVGDLLIEFSDSASRQALLDALLEWSRLDPQYQPSDTGTVAKVAAVLGLAMPAPRQAELV